MANKIPVEELLWAYANGYFPMGEGDQEVYWYRAPKRGIIPIQDFRLSSNVRRLIRNRSYSVRVDHQFEEVMRRCADRESTWINEPIIQSYADLHRTGYAHSVEIYSDGKLAGGLYGVALRGAFFGESMFRVKPEMDKIALHHCHQILTKKGFLLWDTQFYTDHLGRFGAIEVGEQDYLSRLKQALTIQTVFEL